MCLNKTPPVCLHNSPAEISKLENFAESNAKTECTGEGSFCLANPEDGLVYQKSHLDNKPNDSLSTVNMEKQLQGSVPEADLKDKDLEMAKKIFLGNDSIEIGGIKGEVLNIVETESTIPNSSKLNAHP